MWFLSSSKTARMERLNPPLLSSAQGPNPNCACWLMCFKRCLETSTRRKRNLVQKLYEQLGSKRERGIIWYQIRNSNCQVGPADILELPMISRVPAMVILYLFHFMALYPIEFLSIPNPTLPGSILQSPVIVTARAGNPTSDIPWWPCSSAVLWGCLRRKRARVASEGHKGDSTHISFPYFMW